jgi:hypothetical protein
MIMALTGSLAGFAATSALGSLDQIHHHSALKCEGEVSGRDIGYISTT